MRVLKRLTNETIAHLMWICVSKKLASVMESYRIEIPTVTGESQMVELEACYAYLHGAEMQ